MRVSHLLALVAILAACSDSSEPAVVPPTFGVSPTAQWAGGTVLVRSRFFDGLDSLPPVTAAGIAMVTVRLDDSTLSATLPALPTQTAAIEVIDGTTRYLVDSVGIVGFRTHWRTSPAAFGNPVLIAGNGGPMGLAGIVPQPTGGAVGIVALDQQRVIVAPGVQPVAANGLRGVGVTFDSSRYILRDSTGLIAEWQLIPPLTMVDTVPAAFQGPLARTIVRLSESVWLNTHNHVTDVVRSGGSSYQVQIEDPYAYTLSSTANRAIISGGYAGNSVVFEMSTGDTVYRLPFGSVRGAAFTRDGSRLYAVSGPAATPQVVAVNAATGAVLGQAPLDASLMFSVLGLALGRTESRILVAVQLGAVPEVLVYDVGTMALVGRLLAPESTGSNIPGWLDAAIIADDVTSAIYVMGAGGNVWEFDLLP